MFSFGFSGGRGPQGATGPTGPTGPAATPGQIPSGWVNAGNPFTTSSNTFVDVTGASTTVTLTIAAYIWSHCCVTWSGSNEVLGARLVIGAQNGDETIEDDKGVEYDSFDLSLRSSSALAAGAYTIKLQVRSVNGGNVTVRHVDLFALGLQST